MHVVACRVWFRAACDMHRRVREVDLWIVLRLVVRVFQVRSFPDDDEGNVAVNFWFRNVTSFAEEERHVLGIGVEDDHGYQSSEL